MRAMVDIQAKAMDGRIQVEGDELAFTRGGRIKRVVAGAEAWRIPIPCIRAVVMKDSKLTGGFVHLVIGAAEIPNASLWAVSDKPWTLQFRAGHVEAMRVLRDHLEECIATNTAAGIDPAKARHPYVDPTGAEQFEKLQQRLLGDTLVRPPTSGATVVDTIALAREHPSYTGFWSDLDTLPQRFKDDEVLRLLAQGMTGTSPALVALTDRRLILHRDSSMLRLRDELPMPAQVSWRAGVLGGVLTFRSGTRELAISGLSDATGTALLDAVH